MTRLVGLGASRNGGDAEFVEKLTNPLFDVVADRPDRVDVGQRVGQFPVLVPLSGEERAGIAAAHSDHDVGGLDDLVGPRLGELAGDVDAASAIASTAAGLISLPGSEPPDQATP